MHTKRKEVPSNINEANAVKDGRHDSLNQGSPKKPHPTTLHVRDQRRRSPQHSLHQLLYLRKRDRERKTEAFTDTLSEVLGFTKGSSLLTLASETSFLPNWGCGPDNPTCFLINGSSGVKGETLIVSYR